MPAWNLGTTEGGSSGAPLFNDNNQVVGQLHGGVASCANLDGYDKFGRFYASWEGGGTPATRLKDWLDPEQISDLFLEGREQNACDFSIEINPSIVAICADEPAVFQLKLSPNFMDTLQLWVENLPNNATATFSTNLWLPGDSLSLTILNLPNNASNFSFQVFASDGTNEASEFVPVSILTPPPAIPILTTPINYLTTPDIALQLNWTTDSLADNYLVQVAKVSNFSELIELEIVFDTQFVLTNLEIGCTYFWRILAQNECSSTVSETFQFTIEQENIFADNELYFYQGFSPNGDLKNDYFKIENIEQFPGNQLIIFNRWGNRLLKMIDYQNDWQGTWKGERLSAGTYFYLFIDGNGKRYHGFFQLNY